MPTIPPDLQALHSNTTEVLRQFWYSFLPPESDVENSRKMIEALSTIQQQVDALVKKASKVDDLPEEPTRLALEYMLKGVRRAEACFKNIDVR